MSYGPSGIQQEGWTFEVPTQVGIEPSEHGQGEGRKAKKPCKHCGDYLRNKHGNCPTCAESYWSAKRKRPKAVFQVKRLDWFGCSCCLAKIGCGSKIAGRIMGIPEGTIMDKWVKNGVKRFVPPSGNWKQAVSPILTAMRPKIKKTPKINPQREYIRACMADIKDRQRRGFDWSYLWDKEVSRRTSNEKYQGMTIDQRKDRNQRLIMARDPISVRAAVMRHREKQMRLNSDEYLRKARESVKKANAKRKKHDPGFKVQCNLRSRLKDLMATVRNGGADRISDLIGCTTRQLSRHLELSFKRGMGWHNYGTHWHVDHILPCASFNHSIPHQVKQCWHYTNLRPLEATKNLAKSDSITEPQLQLLLCSTH